MSNSPNTGVEHIEPNQAQKEVTANNGFDRLSNFVAETLAVTITGDRQITETEFQTHVRFDLSGTPGAGFLLEVPSTVKKQFIVNNATDATATVQVVGGGGASETITNGEQFTFYTDTTDVSVAGGGGGGGGVTSLDGLSDVDTTTQTPVNGDSLLYLGSDFTPYRLLRFVVLDKDVSDPSTITSPSEGDAYIIGGSAVGAWSGQDNNVAIYFNAAWVFVGALEGMRAWVSDEDTDYVFDGTSWSTASAGGASTFLGLTDTPGSYTAKKLLRVNAAADALVEVDDPLDVGIYKQGQPAAGANIATWVVSRAFTLPSNLTGSQGFAGTAPADSAKDFDIQKNGSSVGTVSFAQSSQTATFTMTSDTSFSAGDRLNFIAPGTQDSALADVSITLKGTKD
jgi:hypothetical protein